MSFILNQFEIGAMANFGYLIGDTKTKEAFVVDPAWELDTFLDQVKKEGMTLKGILLTHVHYDHVNAVEELTKRSDVPVYVHPEGRKFSKSGVNIVAPIGENVIEVTDGQTIKLGETEITFIHTPGHSPGSQCILVGNKLITGDTLFVGGVGRTDLPGSDPNALAPSLRKIAKLPADTEIYPGHRYGPMPHRKLNEELKENPFF